MGAGPCRQWPALAALYPTNTRRSRVPRTRRQGPADGLCCFLGHARSRMGPAAPAWLAHKRWAPAASERWAQTAAAKRQNRICNSWSARGGRQEVAHVGLAHTAGCGVGTTMQRKGGEAGQPQHGGRHTLGMRWQVPVQTPHAPSPLPSRKCSGNQISHKGLKAGQADRHAGCSG